MKKLMFICAALAWICSACEKEAELTVAADELEGTYWHNIRYIYSGYKNGEKYYVDSDETILDGASYATWHFASSDQYVSYVTAPLTHYYKQLTWCYDLQKRQLTIGDTVYDLLQFTSNKLVYRYIDSEGITNTIYYERFDPSPAWLKEVAAYPSYEEWLESSHRH